MKKGSKNLPAVAQEHSTIKNEFVLGSRCENPDCGVLHVHACVKGFKKLKNYTTLCFFPYDVDEECFYEEEEIICVRDGNITIEPKQLYMIAISQPDGHPPEGNCCYGVVDIYIPEGEEEEFKKISDKWNF